MDYKKLIKIVIVDVVLAAAIIGIFIVFKLSIYHEEILKQSISITVTMVFGILFVYSNYTILFKPKLSLEETEDLLEVLYQLEEQSKGCGKIQQHIHVSIKSLKKFKERKEVFKQVLMDHLDDHSFVIKLVNDTENILELNVQKIVKGFLVFDFQEYKQILRNNNNPLNSNRQMQQFQEQIEYIQNICKENSELLLELDHLLNELSRMDHGNKEENIQSIQKYTKMLQELHLLNNHNVIV